ncbi:hypothetical protein [Aminivibrio sp.]|uniref:hypothetical protein n=1 Tax=Aminivibrio sp. TaxID=1872489 RepID=UPI00345EA964
MSECGGFSLCGFKDTSIPGKRRGKLQAPAELFHRVASFVNETFYTLDTICDRE